MLEELVRGRLETGRVTSGPDVAGLVDSVLTDFLDSAAAALVDLDPELAALAHTTRDTVLRGGKRLRPTFAYWGWRGVVGSGPPVDTVVPALAALELLHTFALVHDDVMDASAFRRGRPTAHRAFATMHRAQLLRGAADRFGDAAAILVGDLCLVWADQLIAACGLPGRRLAAARACYDRMRVEAIAGQFLDLLGGAGRPWSTERALLTVRLKTASYTVIRPLHYGAALAETDDPDRAVGGPLHRAYTRYGLAVGEAFQLRDDLLGLLGDPAVTGKPVGDDTDLHKPTVLVQLAQALAVGQQATELRRLLDRGTAADSHRLAALVVRTGAADRVEAMIVERVARAQSALASAPLDAAARTALDALAEVAAWRAA